MTAVVDGRVPLATRPSRRTRGMRGRSRPSAQHWSGRGRVRRVDPVVSAGQALSCWALCAARARPVDAHECRDRAGRRLGAALHDVHPWRERVLAAARGRGDEPAGDLLAVDEQRPEEQGLQPEREQEPERAGGAGQRGGDGDDERDDQRVDRLDEHRGGELGQPAAKERVPGTGEDPDDQRDRREAEQHERDDLGEDHRQRERAEQDDRAERAEEHQRGEASGAGTRRRPAGCRRPGRRPCRPCSRRTAGHPVPGPFLSASYSALRASEPGSWRRKRGA